MAGIMGGSDNTAARQLAATQRQNLAALAAQKGEADQAAVGASASAKRGSGSKLLTFLNIGTSGNDTLG